MAIDTLAYVKALESAGIDRHVAEAHAEALTHALSAEVATKSDLQNAIEQLRLSTKADLAELKHDLTVRTFGMVLGIVGVLDAALFALLRGVH